MTLDISKDECIGDSKINGKDLNLPKGCVEAIDLSTESAASLTTSKRAKQRSNGMKCVTKGDTDAYTLATPAEQCFCSSSKDKCLSQGSWDDKASVRV